ncbi:hypothetical protein ACI2LF_19130 [Kribbella sp. NPDC020789]
MLTTPLAMADANPLPDGNLTRPAQTTRFAPTATVSTPERALATFSCPGPAPLDDESPGLLSE